MKVKSFRIGFVRSNIRSEPLCTLMLFNIITYPFMFFRWLDGIVSLGQ